MAEKIDFVVTWVDGNDEKWKKQKEKYAPIGGGEAHVGVARYRDWDLMRYWFRGVDKFAPWVNNVFFVTCGQVPEWLNIRHPKLKLVSHEEYMPKDALPTFNSNAIELKIHEIKGLSEQFVLFNDDMFLIDHIEPTMFFYNGLPCDYASLDYIQPRSDFWHAVLNDMILINNNFSLKKCMTENRKIWLSLKDIRSSLRTIRLSYRRKYFCGIKSYHNAIPYLKSEFDAMWERFPEKLNKTVHHKFRCNEDNMHWLIRYWRLASGQFYPRSQRYSVLKSVICDKDVSHVTEIITHQKKKEICINDDYKGEKFETMKRILQDAFTTILPEPSSFEIV